MNKAKNKEPQTESKFAWHQDSGYVGHDHKTYLSISELSFEG